ncbi:MAG: DUF6465 family protein [Clostridiales bacterium]|jgi:hypothetical protein|nr:DUF6465 family protein [Clostridiales bacterium]
MKTEFYVEFDGRQINLDQIEDAVKVSWKSDGNKMKDLKSLRVYYKPQERKAYYVVNGESKGENDSLEV